MVIVDGGRDPLGSWLRAAADRRFDPSGHNCMLWVADWILAQTGRDPAATHRGAGSPALAAYLAGTFGPDDLTDLATVEMVRLGFVGTSTPARGDVGVVTDGSRRFAAVCTGPRWAALSAEGLAVASWSVVRAWKVI